MTNNSEDRREKTQNLINKLVEERHEMMILFCEIAGVEPYGHGKSVDSLMEEFCQILVDYVALGQFELFKRITDKSERREEVTKIADKMYSKFINAAILAVDFNDKYDTKEKSKIIDDLDADLTKLGATLAVRFELEDQMIMAMLNKKESDKIVHKVA
jgi:regulator of sigma D